MGKCPENGVTDSVFAGIRQLRAPGFSLLELLVVIAILAILAGLSLGAIGKARANADRAAAVANYRQIGVAIALSVADNAGSLPGPLVLSHSPYYNPADTRQLATQLGSYLGVTNLSLAQPLEVFIPPAYRKDANVLQPDQAILFVVNNGLLSNGEILTPFGEAKAPGSPPMKTAAVPGNAWLLCDADQQNPWLIGQKWANQTPAKPLHSPNRLALFMNGSVGTLTDAELQPVRRGGGPGGGGPRP